MSNKKKLLVILLSIVLGVSAVAGIVIAVRNTTSKAVLVVRASELNYGGGWFEWGDSMTGIMTTDAEQTIYLTETEVVKEVFVSKGEMVKTGDVLFTYDTKLTALNLEKEKLAKDRILLEIEVTEQNIRTLNSITPVSDDFGMGDFDIFEGEEEEDISSKPSYSVLDENAVPSNVKAGWTPQAHKQDGSEDDEMMGEMLGTEEMPYIFLAASDEVTITDTFIQKWQQFAIDQEMPQLYIAVERRDEDGSLLKAWETDIMRLDPKISITLNMETGETTYAKMDDPEKLAALLADKDPEVLAEILKRLDPEDLVLAAGMLDDSVLTSVLSRLDESRLKEVLSSLDDKRLRSVMASLLSNMDGDRLTAFFESLSDEKKEEILKILQNKDDDEEDRKREEEENKEDDGGNESVSGNPTASAVRSGPGRIRQVSVFGSDASHQLMRAYISHSAGRLAESARISLGGISMGYGSPVGSGTDIISPDAMYTSEELSRAKKDQERKLSSLQLDLQESDLKIRRAERALKDGGAKAVMNGVVKEIGDPEDPPRDGSPFLRISSAEGLFVRTAIRENLLGTIKEGDILTVRSWMNGLSYDAEVREISPYPDETGTFSYGSTESFYPVIAYVSDPNAQLQNDEWVEISFNKKGSGSGATEDVEMEGTPGGEDGFVEEGTPGEEETFAEEGAPGEEETFAEEGTPSEEEAFAEEGTPSGEEDFTEDDEEQPEESEEQSEETEGQPEESEEQSGEDGEPSQDTEEQIEEDGEPSTEAAGPIEGEGEHSIEAAEPLEGEGSSAETAELFEGEGGPSAEAAGPSEVIGETFEETDGPVEGADENGDEQSADMSMLDFDLGGSENSSAGLYLWKAFVLEENGNYYVYKRNENDRLEKQKIETGAISGETVEVLSGLTGSDWIAFPYGKNVKEGVRVREGTLEDLYNM